MLTHHPEKFSKAACKDGGDGDKLCPYAISTWMKGKGYESHYKEQPDSTKGKAKKKKKFKDEDKENKKDEHSLWQQWLERREAKCDCDCKNCRLILGEDFSR